MRRPTKSGVQYFLGVFSLAVLLLFANVARGQNTISTVAGSAPPNNVSPTAAPIEGPVAIAPDAAGNLYVVNDNGVIYKVTSGLGVPSSMSIFAGNDTAGFSPNGTLATATLLYQPIGAAVGETLFGGTLPATVEMVFCPRATFANSSSTASEKTPTKYCTPILVGRLTNSLLATRLLQPRDQAVFRVLSTNVPGQHGRLPADKRLLSGKQRRIL